MKTEKQKDFSNFFDTGPEEPERSKITPIFGAVARIFIKPCKKQPATCRIKLCSECCALRENENLYLIALRRA